MVLKNKLSLGYYIIRWCDTKCLSVSDFAARIGRSPAAVYNYRAGTSTPPRSCRNQIALVLGLSRAEIDAACLSGGEK